MPSSTSPSISLSTPSGSASSDGGVAQGTAIALPPSRNRAAPSQSEMRRIRDGKGTSGFSRSSRAWRARVPSSDTEDGPQTSRARSVVARFGSSVSSPPWAWAREGARRARARMISEILRMFTSRTSS